MSAPTPPQTPSPSTSSHPHPTPHHAPNQNHTHTHTRTDPHRVLLLLDIQRAMLAPPPIGVPQSALVHAHLSEILSSARQCGNIHHDHSSSTTTTNGTVSDGSESSTSSPTPDSAPEPTSSSNSTTPHIYHNHPPTDPCPRPLIVHVRNSGDIGEPDEPHAPGWELIFPPLPSELVIDKRKNNAFAGTSLGEIIPPHAEIIVAGFQTDYSIRATCSAALGRGNEVLLIRGAHATYDRIEVLHGGGITPAHRIEAEIEAELEEAGVHLLEMKDVPGLFVGR